MTNHKTPGKGFTLSTPVDVPAPPKSNKTAKDFPNKKAFVIHTFKESGEEAAIRLAASFGIKRSSVKSWISELRRNKPGNITARIYG